MKIPPKPLQKPNLDFERSHPGLVVGIDEVGCGPWAGPLLSGAAYIDLNILSEKHFEGITDSKLLSPAKREKAFNYLSTLRGFHWAVGEVSSSEIDALGLSKSLFRAMEMAAQNLNLPKIDFGLVDGIRMPPLNFPCQCLVKGDQKSLSIAAASIMAKVIRDKIMKELHEQFPHYGWDKNAGYGTALHREGLLKYGITPYHRKSFKPVGVLEKN